MSNFSSNRFDALTNNDATDTLGNTKSVPSDNNTPRTKRGGATAARKLHNRVAVSPPSHRRGRDRGSESGSQAAVPSAATTTSANHRSPSAATAARPPRGRQFDRHSGTGIQDNIKKTNQGWGHPGRAEQDAVHDVLSRDDPAVADEAGDGSGSNTPAEMNYKTLDEYQAAQDSLRGRIRTLEARAPNEGSDESQWKNSVPLERNKDDDYYFGGKEFASKQKNKNKKEKVYLEIDQPPRRQQQSGRHAEHKGRGRRGNRSDADVNISDSSAFPTLGA
ncbi:hypothetical protein BX666DRAFT_2027376 [Dichotomocladium elegans]|nr:hypothetical protein BX666DRAFT_2027376 [Dichotomocladium elegans]